MFTRDSKKCFTLKIYFIQIKTAPETYSSTNYVWDIHFNVRVFLLDSPVSFHIVKKIRIKFDDFITFWSRRWVYNISSNYFIVANRRMWFGAKKTDKWNPLYLQLLSFTWNVKSAEVIQKFAQCQYFNFQIVGSGFLFWWFCRNFNSHSKMLLMLRLLWKLKWNLSAQLSVNSNFIQKVAI